MILVRTGAKNVVNEYVVVIVGEEERVKIAEDTEKCVRRPVSGMPPGDDVSNPSVSAVSGWPWGGVVVFDLYVTVGE